MGALGLPWTAAQAQTNVCLPVPKRKRHNSKRVESKISAILQRKPRGELHPDEGEEGNQLTAEACAGLCVHRWQRFPVQGGCSPLKVILSVMLDNLRQIPPIKLNQLGPPPLYWDRLDLKGTLKAALGQSSSAWWRRTELQVVLCQAVIDETGVYSNKALFLYPFRICRLTFCFCFLSPSFCFYSFQQIVNSAADGTGAVQTAGQ